MPNASLRGIVHSLTKIEGFARRHAPAGITRGSSVSVVDNLGTCRPAARNRTLLFPSNLQVGNFNLIIDHNTMETTIRETLRRPGPHPHWSSSCITPTSHTPDTTIIPIQLHPNSCTETCASPVDRDCEESQEVSSQDVEETNSLSHADRVQDQSRAVTRRVVDQRIGQLQWTISWLMKISCRSRERDTCS